ASVGVAGLIHSGGFGSFSKGFGTAASGLLEAEVVTADGRALIVNACRNPDLFWAIKGGGGGSWGVVTRLTLRTHDLPEFFGAAWGKIKASSDEAFRRLLARFFDFYSTHLFNPHWGEQVKIGSDNTLEISMVCQGLDPRQAPQLWAPFFAWVKAAAADFSATNAPGARATPARSARCDPRRARPPHQSRAARGLRARDHRRRRGRRLSGDGARGRRPRRRPAGRARDRSRHRGALQGGARCGLVCLRKQLLQPRVAAGLLGRALPEVTDDQAKIRSGRALHRAQRRGE